MWRKIFIFALIVAMQCSVSIISILTMGGYAANAEDLVIVKLCEGPERYEYTQAIGVSLSFSGGKANCSGYVKPRGSEWASISVTLYKKNGTNWNIVQSWSGNATGGATAAASGSASVSKGTYKVVATGNVGGKEFPTKSTTKTYT